MVGQAFIDAPPGATGQALTAEPSFAINGPVLGVPTARLTAQFRAGSAPGRYTINFSLNGGNAIQMIVDAD